MSARFVRILESPGFRRGEYVNYSRVEPDYRLREKSETKAESIPHGDGDIFQDSMWTERHWTECESVAGYCSLSAYVTMAIKVYDTATDQLVYSYTGSVTPEHDALDAINCILRDFYGRVGKRL